MESRDATPAEKLDWAKEVCARALKELEDKVFTPDMLLTLLARDPEDQDKYILLTKEDSVHDLIEFLWQATHKEEGSE